MSARNACAALAAMVGVALTDDPTPLLPTVPATVQTSLIANVVTSKRVDTSYGCLVYGCTDDHTTTYWQQITTITKVKKVRVGDEEATLSEQVVSQMVTNFTPVVLSNGMTWATSKAPVSWRWDQ